MESLLQYLSDDIFSYLLMEWIDELAYLDIAICNSLLRRKYLSCLNVIRWNKTITIDSRSKWVKFNIWQKKRQLKMEHLILELMIRDEMEKILLEDIYPDSQYQKLKSLQIRGAYPSYNRNDPFNDSNDTEDYTHPHERINIHDILTRLPNLEKLDMDLPSSRGIFELPDNTPIVSSTNPLKLSDILIYGPNIVPNNTLLTPELQWLQTSCPSLERIDFQIPPAQYSSVFTMFPMAKVIKLWQYANTSSQNMDLIIEHQHLRELSVGLSTVNTFEVHCPHLTDLFLRISSIQDSTKFLQHLSSSTTNSTWQQLQSLVLYSCPWVNAAVLQALVDVCKQLQSIKLMDCSRMTGTGYALLVTSLPQLKFLHIAYDRKRSPKDLRDFPQVFLNHIPSSASTINEAIETWYPSISYSLPMGTALIMEEIDDILFHSTTPPPHDRQRSIPSALPMKYGSLTVLHLENCLTLTVQDYSTIITSPYYAWEDISVVFSYNMYLVEGVDDIFMYHKIIMKIMEKLIRLSNSNFPTAKSLKKLTLKLPIPTASHERLNLTDLWKLALPQLTSLRLHGIKLLEGNMDLIVRLCPKLVDIFYKFV